MVAVTLGGRVGAAASVDTAAASPRKGFFARVYDALVKARMQQAAREIRMHAHLLPYSFDERTQRLVRTDSGDLPFGA